MQQLLKSSIYKISRTLNQQQNRTKSYDVRGTRLVQEKSRGVALEKYTHSFYKEARLRLSTESCLTKVKH